MRIAYPNFDPKQNTFIGCGRFERVPVGTSTAETPEAKPNTPSLDRLILMAHEYADELKRGRQWEIHEQRDQEGAHYVGSSQDLAYLVALVYSIRNLRIPEEPQVGDLWFTGSFSRDHTGIQYVDGFDIKLRGFLEQDQDRLFFVPTWNMTYQLERMCQSEYDHVNMLTLPEFHDLLLGKSDRDIWQKKHVIKVAPDERIELLDTLFIEPEQPPSLSEPEQPSSLSAAFLWLRQKKLWLVVILGIALLTAVRWVAPTVQVKRGDAWLRQGNADAAKRLYASLCHLNPWWRLGLPDHQIRVAPYCHAAHRLGRIYDEEGDFDMALALYSVASNDDLTQTPDVCKAASRCDLAPVQIRASALADKAYLREQQIKSDVYYGSGQNPHAAFKTLQMMYADAHHLNRQDMVIRSLHNSFERRKTSALDRYDVEQRLGKPSDDLPSCPPLEPTTDSNLSGPVTMAFHKMTPRSMLPNSHVAGYPVHDSEEEAFIQSVVEALGQEERIQLRDSALAANGFAVCLLIDSIPTKAGQLVMRLIETENRCHRIQLPSQWTYERADLKVAALQMAKTIAHHIDTTYPQGCPPPPARENAAHQEGTSS